MLVGAAEDGGVGSIGWPGFDEHGALASPSATQGATWLRSWRPGGWAAHSMAAFVSARPGQGGGELAGFTLPSATQTTRRTRERQSSGAFAPGASGEAVPDTPERARHDAGTATRTKNILAGFPFTVNDLS